METSMAELKDLIRELVIAQKVTDDKFKETDARFKETDAQFKETDKRIKAT